MPNSQDDSLMQRSDYAIMTFSALSVAVVTNKRKQPAEVVVMNVLNTLGVSDAMLFLKNLRRIEKELDSQQSRSSCKL